LFDRVSTIANYTRSVKSYKLGHYASTL